MAVTTEQSPQVSNQDAFPPVMNPAYEDHSKVRYEYFKFTQGAAAGDANSTEDLVKLPQGKCRVLPFLSHLKRDAFGASRTLNVGITAHKDSSLADVSAVADNVLDGLDVSAAGMAFMGSGTNAQQSILVDNGDGEAVVQAIVLGGTIPAATVLEGFIAYIKE